MEPDWSWSEVEPPKLYGVGVRLTISLYRFTAPVMCCLIKCVAFLNHLHIYKHAGGDVFFYCTSLLFLSYSSNISFSYYDRLSL